MTGAQAPDALTAFIDRWRDAGGSERANYQLFLTELCTVLDLPRPDPASEKTADNAYVFERRVRFRHPDGSESHGFIDLYRRGCFVCEAKQSGLELESRGWDQAMLRAHGQAQQYARALPADEGRPPFLIVTDVGRYLGLYAEFSRTGATYVPFPDPRSHRIRLEDLRRPEVRDTLRALWTDPLSLDPARRSARVTRAIAADLAQLATSLEAAGHGAETVAAFLMRCLFTMFAEDVGLLPERSFTELLIGLQDDPAPLPHLLHALWQDMNTGSGFSVVLRHAVPRFNGGLFADARALPVNKQQLALLIKAAEAQWRDVEPAIFGTLLERALDPLERHRLGAHYTPRAYVERLVLPTVVEPLREQWTTTQAAALTLDGQGKTRQAIAQVQAFHHQLCTTRVLDPACGSGNFLYVVLEHLKRIEGEVLGTLEALGQRQGLLELAGVSVTPEQMLGLETNPRAAHIAEAVLWIGYLQWHFRSRGDLQAPDPVLQDFHNIECRDAVLDWDALDYQTEADGRVITRWDGRSHEPHPVTGAPVPDETAQVPLERYSGPRQASWPEADFVVGNPPFIGASNLRRALGDGYVEALRQAWPEVPESADYVMVWWQRAAELTRAGKLRRFGLITTNSLRQTFNRRVISGQLAHKKPLSLAFAIPDHPWVDDQDGAAVRIAMTVGRAGALPGELCSVVAERPGHGEGLEVELECRDGVIFADLQVGANVAAARSLQANANISNPGVKLHGAGFIVTPEQAVALGLGRTPGLEAHIRDYRNGRDLAATPRGVMVIDLFGLGSDEVRDRYPEVYQWLLERVKPERDHNKRSSYRNNWWIFGEPRRELRKMLAGLDRYIATVETSKHRVFQFLDRTILPDNMLVNIATDDPLYLGILSSRIHVIWALRTGGTLEDRPRYNKTRCFETFPFPTPNEALTPARAERIRALAERLDAQRKARQALHPKLTLTQCYNVLDRLRELAHPGPGPGLDPGPGAPPPALTAKERGIHDQGLVAVLAEVHDALDREVLAAYGWSDLAADLVGRPGGTTPNPHRGPAQARAEEALLTRLVALNAERAAAETDSGAGQQTTGEVHWLRPEFQNPRQRPGTDAPGRSATQTSGTDNTPPGPQPAVKATAAGDRRPWPKALTDQVQALREVLATEPAPADAERLARRFRRAQTRRVAEILEALVALGQARSPEAGKYSA